MSSHPGNDHPLSYGQIAARIENLRARNICYSCHDLATGEVFPGQPIILDDDRFRVVLDPNPRVHGHTIVVYKPHRTDFTELTPEETTSLFTLCTRVANGIKAALGAEKACLVTMCDGGHNHLHVQVLPCYAGDPVGSKRLVASRAPLQRGEEQPAAIHSAL